MTLDGYNSFCKALPHTTTVVQWGGAHVWKVGGKVFAIGRQNADDQELYVTFKCSPMSYDMLQDMPGCRPAPYLASRGMKWIQRTSAAHLDDPGLKDYLRASYEQVVDGLTRRARQDLGLRDGAEPSINPAPATANAKNKAKAKTKAKTNSKAGRAATERAGNAGRKSTSITSTKTKAAPTRASTGKGAKA
ncbi:MAG: MmcQ/YjbR family DNA-binding protein [Hyphomicrobiaceae bacterium]|nr:MmcQ/YjbR family DNA-binding protein [Hyphomicrobiaceae bacterium]MCC0011445.1 MmcQ/YjbR family DNA-binding protein [Hyphomicrobiaceae bacterium]